MKILFAVNNDNVSEAIAKKYEKQYKDIISYKNVYYFNAIIRELQKDKTYNRIVISEDLEPFANNNYGMIDKFLLDKYTDISKEAKTLNEERIEVILLCADRRKKSEEMLIKIYNLEIYNAIIGQDRSIDEVCKLIYNPRDKGLARQYYDIPVNDLSGQEDSENNVSEAEVENILAHYKRLGRNEDKYVDSFNNIISQYTDTQLKIIIRYLPIHVKAVLEEKSPKYQQLVTSGIPGQNSSFDAKTSKYKEKLQKQKKGFGKKKENNNFDDDDEEENDEPLIDREFTKPKLSQPIMIPSNMNTNNVQKINIKSTTSNDAPPSPFIEEEFIQPIQPNIPQEMPETESSNNKGVNLFDEFDDSSEPEIGSIQERTIQPVEVPEVKPAQLQQPDVNPLGAESLNNGEGELVPQENVEQEQPKRGRGRPRTKPVAEIDPNQPKRGRGRPKKQEPIDTTESTENTEQKPMQTQYEQENDLFSMSEEIENNKAPDLSDMMFETPTQNNIAQENTTISNDDGDIDLFNMEEENQATNTGNVVDTNNYIQPQEVYQPQARPNNSIDIPQQTYTPPMQNNDMTTTNRTNTYSNLNSLLTSDKKIVAFVGTTKNGTSFVVNNTAEMLASMGISTAVLDMTKTKNAYYIYTNNEEELRAIATKCMRNLENGIPEGIKPTRNLTIYTEMPGEEENYNMDKVLSTLVQNYSAVLIDTDFDTPMEVFGMVQEIYLVQTMDVLTIQPLTAFLRNLKSKNILRQEKIKIVVNKSEKIRSLNVRTLIGGMSCYNAPDMSYMTELFDKDNVRYCEIPFEVQNYVKYLDSLVNCSITLNGYTKTLLASLRELANIVYPLVGKQTYSPMSGNRKDPFSQQTSSTLNKMKHKGY